MKMKILVIWIGLLVLNLEMQAQTKSFSIDDFGAIPNDSQSDLKAIQNCINAADKAQKSCFIPKGKYIIDGHLWLPSGMELYGEGKDSILVLKQGILRALKNNNKHFWNYGYAKEIIAGKFKSGLLEKKVDKGEKTFYLNSKDKFSVGDWITINNNRKDTWGILEKQSKGQDSAQYLNGSKDVLAKGQIMKITAVNNNKITIDRELDSDYVAGATIRQHVGARNIYIHDLSFINNSEKYYTILFEQPFKARFENLVIKTTHGAGGIQLLNYAFQCIIKNCTITSSGNFPVTVSNFCSENKILNNDITFIKGGDCAILIMMYSKKNLIDNNKIECLSRERSNDGGIFIHATSFENKIVNNKIRGATAALSLCYGANNNFFENNFSFKSNTGVSFWHAGADNVIKENTFKFEDTRRPGDNTGVYLYGSQSQYITNNTFAGKLNTGFKFEPEADYSLNKSGVNDYTISGRGLTYKSNIILTKNIFQSTLPKFKLSNFNK